MHLRPHLNLLMKRLLTFLKNRLSKKFLHLRIEVSFRDLEPIHLRDDRLGPAAQILLDAPESERNRNQDYDRPRDPTLRAITDGLQHGY